MRVCLQDLLSNFRGEVPVVKELEFYFDFSSPNAYCAYEQLKQLEEEQDLNIELKPVFLGGIMDELETTPPAMQNQIKADYLLMDLERWANFYDIPFNFPEQFPINSLPAIRGFLVLEDEASGTLDEYTERVFRAAWVEGESIENEPVLRDCLPDSVAAEQFFDGIEDPNYKEDLKQRTDNALERGVFGCPMMYFNDEPFWGKDRFQLLEDRLSS